MHYLYIGLGGALGAVCRVALSNLMPATVAGIPFPIMMINIMGCFMIGILSEFIAFYGATTDNIRYFLIPGFLGGFTTFSSFALEVGYLMERDNYWQALTYVGASVVFSLLAFFFGLKLIRMA